MARFFYAIIAALAGAAFVHLAIVLLLPRFSSRDAWTQIEAVSDPYLPIQLEDSDLALPAANSLDPLVAVAACRYDLSDGIFHLTGAGRSDMWTVAVFDDLGNILFSGNDRLAATEEIDLAVATRSQLRGLQQETPPAFSDTVLTEAGREQGFAVVRVYRPDESWDATVDDFMSRLNCRSARP